MSTPAPLFKALKFSDWVGMAYSAKGGPNAGNNPQKQKGAARKTAAPKMSKQPRGKGYGGTKQTGKGKPSAGGKASY